MNGAADRIVTADTFERCLSRLDAVCPDRNAGLFGPGSLIWRVNKEALVFLGAARALLLQLAHPWVAAGIAQHSTTLADPIGRFHRTFGSVYAMVFGTRDQAFAAARALYRVHGFVAGHLPEAAGSYAAGTPYAANAVEPLAWVQATLVDSALLVHDLVRSPLTPSEREAYYAETMKLGLLFGLEPEEQPRNWDAFRTWFDSMVASGPLGVAPSTRRFAATLLDHPVRGPAVPRWYRALTAAMMPAAVSDGFGLVYGPREAKLADRALRTARMLYPRLPSRLREVGPYRESVERLAGCSPGALTRLSNRLWIGRPTLG